MLRFQIDIIFYILHITYYILDIRYYILHITYYILYIEHLGAVAATREKLDVCAGQLQLV